MFAIYHKTTGGLSAVFLAIILFLSLLEIVARGVGHPTSWSLDVSCYLLCALTVTAAPALVAARLHVAIDLIVERLPPSSKAAAFRALCVVSGLACIVTATLCIWIGVGQYEKGIRTLGSTAIPKWLLSAGLAYAFGSSALIYGYLAVKGRHADLEPETAGAF